MNNHDNIDWGYLELLHHVLYNGRPRKDRTGTGTRSILGAQIRHDFVHGFPLLTTKRVHWKSIVAEACWMLRGETNVKFLQDRGVSIWDEWAGPDGELGPVYGKQMRGFKGAESVGGQTQIYYIDQLAELVQGLVENPYSRRHLVTMWNPPDVPAQKLPPCHFAFQCYVEHQPEPASRKLSIHVFCRSIDIFLGLPFDIGLYGTILKVLCNMTGYVPGELVFSISDLHLYNNHVAQAQEQLTRVPLHDMPQLHMLRDFTILNLDSIDTFDFAMSAYEHQPAIKAEVSI